MLDGKDSKAIQRGQKENERVAILEFQQQQQLQLQQLRKQYSSSSSSPKKNTTTTTPITPIPITRKKQNIVVVIASRDTNNSTTNKLGGKSSDTFPSLLVSRGDFCLVETLNYRWNFVLGVLERGGFMDAINGG